MNGLTKFIFDYDYLSQHKTTTLICPDDNGEMFPSEEAEQMCKSKLKRDGVDLNKIKNWTPTQLRNENIPEEERSEYNHLNLGVQRKVLPSSPAESDTTEQHQNPI